MVLEKVGYRVRTAMEIRQVVQILEEEVVHLSILCQSLSFAELRVALVAVRDLGQESKIISLIWDKCICELSLNVEVVNVFLTPAIFIDRVARILNQPKIEPTIQ